MAHIDKSLDHQNGPSNVTQRRKSDHIRINLEQEVYGQGPSTGLERYRFLHNALPELDLAQVQTATSFLGRQLAMPVVISSMTGGTPEARQVLRTLAAAAEQCGCAIGVGSQRAVIEDPSLSGFFDVRDVAPTAAVFANIGAVQLNYGIDVDGCRQAVDMLRADALILHLNPIQEAVQPEGNQNFAGLAHKIGKVCAGLDVPVIVKEVGFGISADVATRLVDQGVAAIDVSGVGGTSWSAVESHRATTPLHRQLGAAFTGWGIPTADSIRMVRDALPTTPVIGSGGLRDGIDAAKALSLGADLAGFAGPLLKAAVQGEDAVIDTLNVIREQIRLVMFGVGSATIDELRAVPLQAVSEQGSAAV